MKVWSLETSYSKHVELFPSPPQRAGSAAFPASCPSPAAGGERERAIVHVPPPQRPTCISSYLSCVPPLHLKGSNVPSSASAWQDPQGSRPWVGVPKVMCFQGRLPASPVQLHAQRNNLKAEWRLFPLKCMRTGS